MKEKKICFQRFPFHKLFFWQPQPRIPAEVPGGFRNINQFRSWRPRLSSGKTFYIKQIVLCPCQGRQRFKLNMQRAAVGCLPQPEGGGRESSSLLSFLSLQLFFFSCFCFSRGFSPELKDRGSELGFSVNSRCDTAQVTGPPGTSVSSSVQ